MDDNERGFEVKKELFKGLLDETVKVRRIRKRRVAVKVLGVDHDLKRNKGMVELDEGSDNVFSSLCKLSIELYGIDDELAQAAVYEFLNERNIV